MDPYFKEQLRRFISKVPSTELANFLMRNARENFPKTGISTESLIEDTIQNIENLNDLAKKKAVTASTIKGFLTEDNFEGKIGTCYDANITALGEHLMIRALAQKKTDDKALEAIGPYVINTWMDRLSKSDISILSSKVYLKVSKNQAPLRQEACPVNVMNDFKKLSSFVLFDTDTTTIITSLEKQNPKSYKTVYKGSLIHSGVERGKYEMELSYSYPKQIPLIERIELNIYNLLGLSIDQHLNITELLIASSSSKATPCALNDSIARDTTSSSEAAPCAPNDSSATDTASSSEAAPRAPNDSDPTDTAKKHVSGVIQELEVISAELAKNELVLQNLQNAHIDLEKRSKNN